MNFLSLRSFFSLFNFLVLTHSAWTRTPNNQAGGVAKKIFIYKKNIKKNNVLSLLLMRAMIQQSVITLQIKLKFIFLTMPSSNGWKWIKMHEFAYSSEREEDEYRAHPYSQPFIPGIQKLFILSFLWEQ